MPIICDPVAVVGRCLPDEGWITSAESRPCYKNDRNIEPGAPMNNFRFASAAMIASLVTAIAAPAATAATLPADLDVTPWITSGIPVPMAIRNAHDGSNRLFIVTRGGSVFIAPNAGQTVNAQPFLSFGSNAPLLGFSQSGEGGLLGLAFHPNFASNGYVFVDYTDARLDTVVARFTLMAGDPTRLDPASQVVLLRIDQDFTNHKGGDIHFGPDGFLYIGLGDGGSGGDPCHRAQTIDPAQLQGPASGGSSGAPNDCASDDDFLNAGLSPRGNSNSRSLLGKLLRIDVDHTTPAGANGLCAASPVDGSANYAVPPSNPFAGGGTANGCDEIWDYGLRNPFRFSFDRLNGDLFIGDVGQNNMEEQDYEPRGSAGGINYGWNNCEGTLSFNGGSCSGSQPPILTYVRSGNDNCASTTGGFRYHGPIGAINGLYWYADYCTGRIYVGELSGGAWSGGVWKILQTASNTQALNSIVSFGEDENGNLYIADITRSRVLKFTSTDPLFTDGLE